jgi:predicted nucleic-acid-binding Zn-ribbon protein
MKSGRCTKCHSNNVHVVNSLRNHVVVPLSLLSMVGSATSLYVCVDCGYLEIYVQDLTDLQKIGETWPKVSD